MMQRGFAWTRCGVGVAGGDAGLAMDAGVDDSPWYPSARNFRQKRLGDWREVVDKVRETHQKRFRLE